MLAIAPCFDTRWLVFGADTATRATLEQLRTWSTTAGDSALVERLQATMAGRPLSPSPTDGRISSLLRFVGVALRNPRMARCAEVFDAV